MKFIDKKFRIDITLLLFGVFMTLLIFIGVGFTNLKRYFLSSGSNFPDDD